jgi:hypothetical protein
MTTLLAPSFTATTRLVQTLQAIGHAVLSPEGLCELLGSSLPTLQALQPYWADLPCDDYLRDGGRYRQRRHACFKVFAQHSQAVAHRAHWQPVQYNALHGGLQRWFKPLDERLVACPVWAQLLQMLAGIFGKISGCLGHAALPWFVEAHQFRIDTTDGIGRPTPEGAHRDGVDFVAVLLVARHGIKGGETRVFDAYGPNGQRFTMTEPWTLLLLDDARVIHESTPIQPLAPLEPAGYRDTLVLTFRRSGFQGPDDASVAGA